jgi:hypothetical protein
MSVINDAETGVQLEKMIESPMRRKKNILKQAVFILLVSIPHQRKSVK